MFFTPSVRRNPEWDFFPGRQRREMIPPASNVTPFSERTFCFAIRSKVGSAFPLRIAAGRGGPPLLRVIGPFDKTSLNGEGDGLLLLNEKSGKRRHLVRIG